MTSPSARDIANMPITRWHPIIDVTCICMHTCVTHTGGHLGTLVCLHAFLCVCFLKKRPPWHTRMPTRTTAQFSVCYTHTGVLQHTLCVTTHLGTQHRLYMLDRPPWHTRRPTRTTAQFLHAHMHAYCACPSHTQQQPHTGAVTHRSSHMHPHRAAGVLNPRTLGGQVGLVINGERHCPSRDRPHGS